MLWKAMKKRFKKSAAPATGIAKARPIPTFRNYGGRGRAEQNVYGVQTPKQARTAAKMVAQMGRRAGLHAEGVEARFVPHMERMIRPEEKLFGSNIGIGKETQTFVVPGNQAHAQHEAFHGEMSRIRNQYGDRDYQKIVDTMMSHIHPDDKSALYLSLLAHGYRAKSPSFDEELLAHTHTYLTDKDKRDATHKIISPGGIIAQSILRERQQGLKTGNKEQIDFADHLEQHLNAAKNFKPSRLSAAWKQAVKWADAQRPSQNPAAEEKLAASEDLKKYYGSWSQRRMARIKARNKTPEQRREEEEKAKKIFQETAGKFLEELKAKREAQKQQTPKPEDPVKKALQKAGPQKPMVHGPDKIRAVADRYAKTKGIKLNHAAPKAAVDPARAQKIAAAYGAAQHNPGHPDVKAAYDALTSETADQFRHILGSGLKISKIQPGQENPYKNGSKDLFHDIHHNNHMWYFPTESGFGSQGADTSDHPLLKPTEFQHGGKPMLANDVFRIVHDYFGHAKEGYGFGPQGEENAYRIHKEMYSPAAQRALTAETRGQNSFVNFGPHGEHNRKNPGQTIYADQKATLLPDWAMDTSNIGRGFGKSLSDAIWNSLRKSDFKKGVMRRLAPYNPMKIRPTERGRVETWIGGHVSDPNELRNIRSSIPKANKAVLRRGIHKIMSYAQTRRNPKTNEPEILLHRGMGGTERHFNSNKNIYSSLELTSWTPRFDFAHDMANMYARGEGDAGRHRVGHVVSAWVPISAIHHVPLQIGSKAKFESEIQGIEDTKKPEFKSRLPKQPIRRRELEVIVGPKHKLSIHKVREVEGNTRLPSEDMDSYYDTLSYHLKTGGLEGKRIAAMDPIEKPISERPRPSKKLTASEMQKAREDKKFPPQSRRAFRHARREFEGIDRLQEQLTTQPGVSRRGIEARRGDVRVPGAVAHGYARVGEPQQHIEAAKRGFGKSLSKGVMRRLYPFSPQSPALKEIKQKTYKWQQQETSRPDLYFQGESSDPGRLPRNAKMRAMNKLHRLTASRRNPETGEVEFLLHRGTKQRERDFGSDKYYSPMFSSWTPHRHVAADFGKVMSAWVPESDIHSVLPQLGTTSPRYLYGDKGPNEWRMEHEVVVRPESHSVRFAKPEELNPQKDIHTKISQRAQRSMVSKAGEKLEHYSPHSGLKEISPEFEGQGVDKYARRQDRHPKSFFYLAGTEPEHIVASGARSRYTVDLGPEHRIYDLGTDPEGIVAGLRSQAAGRQVNPGVVDKDDMHAAIKAAGFSGYRNSRHPQLPNVVAMYHPVGVSSEEPVEKTLLGLRPKKYLGLQKGDFARRAAAMAGIFGALSQPVGAEEPKREPAAIEQPQPAAEKPATLRAIAAVESSGGINTQHAELGGMHAGERAFGKYGLTPIVIRETIKKHPDLSKQHGAALNLKGQEFADYMKKNPGLEDVVASRHYDRLRRHFGPDLSKIGYAWLNGVVGTARAAQKGVDFDNHWHVKKLKQAYENIKNKSKR